MNEKAPVNKDIRRLTNKFLCRCSYLGNDYLNESSSFLSEELLKVHSVIAGTTFSCNNLYFVHTLESFEGIILDKKIKTGTNLEASLVLHAVTELGSLKFQAE